MIEAREIRFCYKNGPAVLQGVSFTAASGDFMAILGNNGAGKSTLLKCMNGILKPDSGGLLLDGEDLFALPRREIARRVAFVGQNAPDARMTVHDMVMLGRRPYMDLCFTRQDHAIVHEAMDRMGVSALRGRFLDELSGGERQKVMLARALAQQPRLLLLDEPTSSLDVRSQYGVLNTVAGLCRDGLSAVMVIHDLTLALRFCGRLLLLKEGRAFCCGGPEVLDSEALQAVYGVSARPVEIGGRRIVLVNE